MKNIELNGVQYPVHLSMGAIKRVTERTGKSLNEILAAGDSVAVCQLVYSAMESGCKIAKMKLDLSEDDFLELVDMAFLPTMLDVLVSDLPQAGGNGQAAGNSLLPN